VYFDVATFAEYGKLSGQKVEELMGGSRVEPGSHKRHAADFALWRHAEPEHLMQWDSPWGKGFPGWHTECSAMAIKYLGETFDIHGGGLENRFPHNECEIAQSEAATGKPFARYWLLTGSLTIDGVKMSKSLGNFVTIRDALERYRPEAIRTFILSSHYGHPVDYSDAALASAEKGWERLMGAVGLVRQAKESAPEGDAGAGFREVLARVESEFAAAMDDDFNAPKALGALQGLTREVNTLLNSDEEVGRDVLDRIDGVYRALGGDVLGIVPDEMGESGVDAGRLDGLVKLLIALRQDARERKDFAQADRIRDALADLGVTLEDRPDGTVYRVT
jgi:cysteinyl-tRNA synthetase